MKPDVVAPGSWLTSGSSSGKNPPFYHCGTSSKNLKDKTATLNRMEGTSHSASVISGAAALIRQYFSEKMQIHHFNKITETPSGILLKALIIHSSQAMNGIVLKTNDYYETLPLSKTKFPNELNGFGLPDLSFIIPFKNEQLVDNQPKFSIFVENMKYFTSTTGKFSYSFLISNSESKKSNFTKYFRATLVWYDSPSDPLTVNAESILNNDLDLVVKMVEKNKIFFGNNVTDGDNGNTVERVDVLEDDLLYPSSSSTIIVDVNKGKRFLNDKIPFSLVVSTNMEVTFNNPVSIGEKNQYTFILFYFIILLFF